jgi:molecular chaperone DnaK (HSP70)
MDNWLFLLCMIGASVAAVLGAYGYRGREEQIVGIDLGTTFSVVAVKRRDGVEIIPDFASKSKIVPSTVSFMDDGTVLVGDEAVKMRSKFPQSTVFNAKRLIGRPYDDVHDSIDVTEHPVRVVNGTDEPKVKGRVSGSRFAVEVGGSEVLVSPEEVGTHIVKRLGKSVEETLGWAISRAVICVPAKFSGPQRKATQHAFEKAGIKVMRVMDEPTAAAVAYDLDRIPEPRNILVYDIGGGTLDTSLLFMNGDSIKSGKAPRGTITPLGTDGDDHLGGADFDQAMYEMLRDRVSQGIAQGGRSEETKMGSLPACEDNHMRVEAEALKKSLSTTSDVAFRCQHEGKAIDVSITRDEYEDKCKPLFERALAPVHRVLDSAMMEPEDIHHVVLVGGASRMPKLRELLRSHFGDKDSSGKGKIRHDIDPDVTVAWGAANIVD